jgi:hypothetical protein
MQAGCKRSTADCTRQPFRFRIARAALVSSGHRRGLSFADEASRATNKKRPALFPARAQFLNFNFPTNLILFLCQ